MLTSEMLYYSKIIFLEHVYHKSKFVLVNLLKNIAEHSIIRYNTKVCFGKSAVING